MKLSHIKCLEIFTNGTVSFSSASSTNLKQVIFYEKDLASSKIFKKPMRNQTFQTLLHTSYKSKYKF